MIRTFLSSLIVLSALVLLPVLSQAADGAARLNQLLNGIQTFEARFEQTTYTDAGKVQQQSRGTVVIARPGRFYWKVESPFTQEILGADDRVQIYDPDLEQVVERSISKEVGNTPAMLLSGDVNRIAALFTVTTSDNQQFKLVPNSQDQQFLEMNLVFEGETLVSLFLIDSLGQKTLIDFSDIRTNQPVDPEQFVLELPPGVDVISDL